MIGAEVTRLSMLWNSPSLAVEKVKPSYVGPCFLDTL